MTSRQLIVVAGLPGSGKSTVAEALSGALSLPVFSIDPIEAAMWRGGLARELAGSVHALAIKAHAPGEAGG